MQIVGVYRNCKCMVPIAHWGNPDEFMVTLSTNHADNIKYAEQYWKNNGIAAIVLLGIVCYSGWWYQRHWRLRLSNCIDDVVNEAKRAKSGDIPVVMVNEAGGTGTAATTSAPVEAVSAVGASQASPAEGVPVEGTAAQGAAAKTTSAA
jgi:hypothetical protein